MQLLTVLLLALSAITLAHPRALTPDILTDPTCKAHGELCAELMVGDRVHQ
jgi:hypothetical protein